MKQLPLELFKSVAFFLGHLVQQHEEAAEQAGNNKSCKLSYIFIIIAEVVQS